MLKRFIFAAVVVTVVCATAGPAGAAGGATVEVFPVTFTIPDGQCPNLPAGTTVEGEGTMRSVTIERTRDDVTTIINSSHAIGTATDQDGNSYRFAYSNEFRASNSATAPTIFSGRMTDHFSLSGPGPARLSNGFVADFTTDFATFFDFDPLQQHGDPITFPEGVAVCDPL